MSVSFARVQAEDGGWNSCVSCGPCHSLLPGGKLVPPKHQNAWFREGGSWAASLTLSFPAHSQVSSWGLERATRHHLTGIPGFLLLGVWGGPRGQHASPGETSACMTFTWWSWPPGRRAHPEPQARGTDAAGRGPATKPLLLCSCSRGPDSLTYLLAGLG